MQYGHIYAAICIMIKLKVMFWKLYTSIDFNVGTFNLYRMFFADITVNPQPILMKFCKGFLQVTRRLH